jgi:hypothetical protein
MVTALVLTILGATGDLGLYFGQLRPMPSGLRDAALPQINTEWAPNAWIERHEGKVQVRAERRSRVHIV